MDATKPVQPEYGCVTIRRCPVDRTYDVFAATTNGFKMGASPMEAFYRKKDAVAWARSKGWKIV